MSTPDKKTRWVDAYTGAGQGLIYDEQTGAAIAVCYDTRHTKLIARAPALLAALKELQANPNDPRAHRTALDALAEVEA